MQWNERKDELNQKGTAILDALMRATQLQSVESTGLPGPEVAGKCYKQLIDSYDTDYGGFGEAPKFPQPGELSQFDIGVTLLCSPLSYFQQVSRTFGRSSL